MSSPSLAGTSLPFTFQGATYRVAGRCTFRQRAAFAQWVADEVYRGVQRTRALVGEEVFRISLKGWRDDLGTHQYDWGEPACHNALYSDAGTAQLALILMKAAEAEARQAGQAVEAYADESLLDRVREDPAGWAELRGLLLGTAEHPGGIVFPNPAGPAAQTQAPAPG